MNTALPAEASLVHIASGDGEDFQVAGAKLTWKVKSNATQGRFGFFEQVLQPGEGVPMHVHSFTETFYILAGSLTFFQDTSGSLLKAGIGDVVMAPPGALNRAGSTGGVGL